MSKTKLTKQKVTSDENDVRAWIKSAEGINALKDAAEHSKKVAKKVREARKLPPSILQKQFTV